jgi:hypothetical protein
MQRIIRGTGGTDLGPCGMGQDAQKAAKVVNKTYKNTRGEIAEDDDGDGQTTHYEALSGAALGADQRPSPAPASAASNDS